MALDWITEPVSEDEPCGPDLDAADDAEFVDYYFDALGRLPDPYFTPGVNRGDAGMSDAIVFDPKSVELKRELDNVDPMLKRSRDVRLFALRAQWQILAGRLEDMAETMDSLALAIETFGTDLHPSTSGGIAERREALMELSQQDTVLLPLMYYPMDTTGSATVRRMRVAQGDFTPQSDEDGIEAGSITSALATPGDRKKVDSSHEALLKVRGSIDRITAACKANESGPFSPGLEPLTEMIDRMLGMIGDARPDLRDAADAATTEEPIDADDGDVGEDGEIPEGGGSGVTVAGAPVHVGPVQSHAAARQALLATEAYLQNYEPSSAALLLVTQARQLIGMPLMDALQVLLPQHAHRAVVSFGPQDGFELTTDRLNSLSGEVSNAAPVEEDTSEVPDPPVVDSSNAAAAVLRTVEDFYRSKEKSSPVPILLQRARTYMSKDFQSLIEELIPPEPEPEPSGY